MIKNGKIKTGFIRDDMFVVKLYENLQLYKNTLEYLKTTNNIDLQNEVKFCCKTIYKLYKLHYSQVVLDAVTNDINQKDIEFNNWLDVNITNLLKNILGDDYDK